MLAEFTDPDGIPQEQVENPRTKTQREVFDAVRFIHGIELVEMAALPVERLAALVADLRPEMPLAMQHLRQAVEAYVTDRDR